MTNLRFKIEQASQLLLSILKEKNKFDYKLFIDGELYTIADFNYDKNSIYFSAPIESVVLLKMIQKSEVKLYLNVEHSLNNKDELCLMFKTDEIIYYRTLLNDM